jgi:predicted nucleic acid-binding protein
MTVLDTNVVLYHLAGKLADQLPTDAVHISVISEIELLSYPPLGPQEEEIINLLIAEVIVVGVTDRVKREAIALRKLHRLKLADAMIAATAKCLDAELLTYDPELLRLPSIKATMPLGAST